VRHFSGALERMDIASAPLVRLSMNHDRRAAPAQDARKRQARQSASRAILATAAASCAQARRDPAFNAVISADR
jgi:hypothetical protein